MPIPELNNERVLVTGGAGFIGSHLVEVLLQHGARVRVLDDLSTGRRQNLHHCLDQIDFLKGDIRNPETCDRAAADCHYVFHQAALGSVPRSVENPAASFEVNVQGTVNVLSSARRSGVERLVFASSSSVYGDNPTLPKREGEEGAPLSPYACTKQIDEQVARVFETTYGLETVGLRYFNVYGARQDPDGPYAAVIPRFFKAALAGEPMVIYGDGAQSRDFTHVSDAVRANLLAAGALPDACGRSFNVAAGRATTVRDLAAEVARLCGAVDKPLNEPPRRGDVRHSRADLSRSEKLLEYTPNVDLAAGLAATLDYYREPKEST